MRFVHEPFRRWHEGNCIFLLVMKREVATTETTFTGGSVLAYSTWLVLGVWLIFQGGEQIIRAALGDNSLLGYFMGALRIVIGALLLPAASKSAQLWNEPRGSAVRAMTFVLLMLIVGVPLVVVVVHTSVILSGQAEADENYRRHVMRLALIAATYVLATIWAGWRLKKRACMSEEP